MVKTIHIKRFKSGTNGEVVAVETIRRVVRTSCVPFPDSSGFWPIQRRSYNWVRYRGNRFVVREIIAVAGPPVGDYELCMAESAMDCIKV